MLPSRKNNLDLYLIFIYQNKFQVDQSFKYLKMDPEKYPEKKGNFFHSINSVTKACVYIYVHTHNGSMHVGSIYVCEQMYTCGKKNHK